MSACLQPPHIAALLGGTLPSNARRLTHRHIDRCDGCRASVAQAARDRARAAYGIAAVPASLGSGDVIGHGYRIGHRIGEGGSGVVWEATHEPTGRIVALKILRSFESQSMRRSLREARVTAALQHPNVVPVLDTFAAGGASILVLERLVGTSLADLLRRSLSFAETAACAVGVSRGLGAAHALGIVHRDLKPANVFVRSGVARAENVVVLDFGIAKLTAQHGVAANTGALTRSNALLGTPHYMAPEQVQAGATVSAATDVWALGVILYEALAGARPLAGRTPIEAIEALAFLRIAPLGTLRPDLPPSIAAMVDRMLRRESVERPDLTEVEATFLLERT